MRKTLTTLLALAGALALHAQDGGGQAVFGGFQLPEVKMEYSVKYADVDYAGDGEVFHRLDIYLPEERKESYPVVIHIYGSAWFSNNSKGMADLGTICQALLDAGYAVVTPNHRSSGDAAFPAQINDIKAVVRFIRANAAQYRLDPSFIAASGFSSGGHLAALAATSADVEQLEGEVGGNLQFSSAVDAACAGNPGRMEYRGVCLRTGQEVFHFGPVYGTNNIGEFLAIVHALALLKQQGLPLAVYSDSRNALLWVRKKKCKTSLARTARTEALFQLIDRAEKWLHENTYDTPLLKWETQLWGEVPADFGRK